MYWDGTQHYQYCKDCADYQRYGAHTGGTATCTDRAECTDCGWTYGETDPDNHGDNETTDWTWSSGTQHAKLCEGCGKEVKWEDHRGGEATCVDWAMCEVCGVPYGDYDLNNHGEFTKWFGYDDTQHYRYCSICFGNEEYEDHAGGTATCTKQAVCETCGMEYGDLLEHVDEGNNGIVTGYSSNEFGPDDPITREQMAAIFYRYSQAKGYDLTEGSYSNFSDAATVSEYAQAPMRWAVGNGLMVGMGNGTLRPANHTNRAQVAAILCRFVETFVK